MPLHAIIFSDLSALAETDALHRQAVNAALSDTGEEEMSTADFAALSDPDMHGLLQERHGAGLADRAAELYRDRMSEIGLTPRPGVAEIMSAAQAQGVRLALVSSLDRDTLRAGLEAFGATIEPGHFAEIIAREQGGTTAGGHRRTLDLLEAKPVDGMAIAPSPGRARAARGADLPVTAFPSAAYRNAAFEDVTQALDELGIGALGLSQPV